jgi:hypothetical protein
MDAGQIHGAVIALAGRAGFPIPADTVTASAAEFANPWHDERGRFAPKGSGRASGLDVHAHERRIGNPDAPIIMRSGGKPSATFDSVMSGYGEPRGKGEPVIVTTPGGHEFTLEATAGVGPKTRDAWVEKVSRAMDDNPLPPERSGVPVRVLITSHPTIFGDPNCDGITAQASDGRIYQVFRTRRSRSGADTANDDWIAEHEWSHALDGYRSERSNAVNTSTRPDRVTGIPVVSTYAITSSLFNGDPAEVYAEAFSAFRRNSIPRHEDRHGHVLPGHEEKWGQMMAQVQQFAATQGWNPTRDGTVLASAGEFANPWHDERGRFAPKGSGRAAGIEAAPASLGWRDEATPHQQIPQANGPAADDEYQRMLDSGYGPANSYEHVELIYKAVPRGDPPQAGSIPDGTYPGTIKEYARADLLDHTLIIHDGDIGLRCTPGGATLTRRNTGRKDQEHWEVSDGTRTVRINSADGQWINDEAAALLGDGVLLGWRTGNASGIHPSKMTVEVEDFRSPAVRSVLGRGPAVAFVDVHPETRTTIHVSREAANSVGSHVRGERAGSTYRETMPDHGSALPAIATHETGHVMQAHSSSEQQARIDAIYASSSRYPGMSVYGSTAPWEFYAEAFAEWTLTGGRTSNPAAVMMADVMKWGTP